MIKTSMLLAVSAAVAGLALSGAALAQTAPKVVKVAKPVACAKIKAEADCTPRADCRWATAYTSKVLKKEVPAQCKAKAKKVVKKVVKPAA